MRLCVPVITAALVAGSALADPPAPTPIKSEKGKTVVATGKLENGKPLSTLEWAWSSSVACFPGTEAQKYDGNHVFFTADLPAKSEMYITIVPKDPNVNLSGYAYSVGPDKVVLPPNLSSVVSCEAESKWDRPKKNKTQDHTRVLPRLTAIKNPYSVVIGVTAPKAVTAGEFEVKVEIK